jgi:hypothetical protein
MKRKLEDAPTHPTNNSWTRGGKGSKNPKDAVKTIKRSSDHIKNAKSSY